MSNYKHLTTLACLFVAVLLISNIVSTKLVDFGPFTFDAGTLLFPLVYIFWDIFTEVYGYKASRKIIWLWFISALLMSVVIIAVWVLPAAGDWPYQESYMNILGLTPRIVLASLIAYVVGEFSNAFIVAKMKVWQNGKQFWKRAIGSTIVGQWLDTILFVIIAFAGIFPWSVILTIVLSNYIFKLLVEVLFLPLTSLVVRKLKTQEQVDVYDDRTNFSPFGS